MFDLKFDPVEHIYHTKGPNDPDWVETPSVSTFISPLYGSGKSYFTPESALRGTRVHLATELDDLGKLDHSSIRGSKIEGHLAAWREAIDGKLEAGIVEVECRFAHEIDGVRYCGTVDRILELPDGRLAVADLKTGRLTRRPHAAQVQAYRLGMEAVLGREIEECMTIHTSEDGSSMIKKHSGDEWEALWLRQLKNYKKENA